PGQCHRHGGAALTPAGKSVQRTGRAAVPRLCPGLARLSRGHRRPGRRQGRRATGLRPREPAVGHRPRRQHGEPAISSGGAVHRRDERRHRPAREAPPLDPGPGAGCGDHPAVRGVDHCARAGGLQLGAERPPLAGLQFDVRVHDRAGADRHPRHRPATARVHPGEPGQHAQAGTVAGTRAKVMRRPQGPRAARFFATLALVLSGAQAHAANFTILSTLNSPQADYASRRLREALDSPGVMPAQGANAVIELRVDKDLGAEAFSIRASGRNFTIVGGDSRGLIYGALELREQLLDGTPLDAVAPTHSKPALAFRGIKFNTPWDSYRPSTALDQHYDTVRDLKFWERFLDMMVENRFNAISLWTMHPFTYMIRPKNFPEASKWTPQQFAEWQQLYQGIFRLAKERGLDTYVVFWSIFVSEEFSKAHGVAKQNFYPHYYVDGDTSEITKRYLRESVTQMLEEYPDLDGIGVSHGEGMGGMTPLERQQFVDEVFIAGALAARRATPVKLIHRVPFSSGLTSGPGVS